MKTKVERIRKRIRGKVSITLKNVQTGETRVVGENLVVNNAYVQLARLLGNLVVNPVANIAFGIGGAVPPAPSDTGITGAVVLLPVVVAYPYAYTVQFTATLDSADVSGANINEVGLLFNDNSLAARWVFGVMTKSAGWSWEVQWEFSYTV